MRTNRDRAGRLPVSLPLRGQVGLQAGGEVEIEVDGASIRVEPAAGLVFAEERGLLVIPSLGLSLDDAAVRELRDIHRR